MFLNFLGNTLCLTIGLAVCFFTNFLLRSSIIEVGYGNKVKRRKLIRLIEQYSFLERMLLFRLCRESKQNKGKTYFYAGINLIVITAAFLILGNWVCVVFSGKITNAVYIGLGIPMLVFCVVGIITFIPDLLLVKSVRKRYNNESLILGAIILGTMILGMLVKMI